MKLVTTTEVIGRRFDDETAVKLIKQAGFDGYDYNLCHMFMPNNPLGEKNYANHAKKVRTLADSFDIPCLQAHAPFGELKDKNDATASLDGLFRSIEIANIVGCPILIVHPGNDFTAEQNYDYIYSKILPTAKQAGVKIATENMWNWDEVTYSHPAACGTEKDFVAHVDIANDPYLVACLDIGHSHMAQAPGAPALIKALGKKRLGALHIHDNDLIHDNHTIPFAGNIDWAAIINALKEIDYQGNFTFEADSFLTRFPNELIPDALKLMEKIGRWFVKQIKE